MKKAPQVFAKPHWRRASLPKATFCIGETPLSISTAVTYPAASMPAAVTLLAMTSLAMFLAGVFDSAVILVIVTFHAP